MRQEHITKILFMDDDEMSFAIRQCIARALTSLPPVELFHVTRASDAIEAIDSISPDVIIVDDTCLDEFELLKDCFTDDHPHILLQSNQPQAHKDRCSDIQVSFIEKSQSIDGLRRTLVAATDLVQGKVSEFPSSLH